MNKTQNFGMSLPDLSNNADINVLNENFSTIDNGLTPFFIATKSADNIYKVSTGLNKTSIENGYCIRVAILESSTGPVSILLDTITVPVKKSGGGSVSNFKANSVYSLTYYNSVFILTSSGGGDDVNFTNDKLLEGYTANDSDGEKVTGTMKNNGVISQNLGINGNITLPNGYYDSIKISQNIATKGAATYTPSTSNQVINSGQYLSGNQIILGDVNLKSENILSGKSIFGINGNVTIESLGGRKCVVGEVAELKELHDFVENKLGKIEHFVIKVPINFEPKYVVCFVQDQNPSTSTYFKGSEYVYMNSANSSTDITSYKYPLSKNSFMITKTEVIMPVANTSYKAYCYIVVG